MPERCMPEVPAPPGGTPSVGRSPDPSLLPAPADPAARAPAARGRRERKSMLLRLDPEVHDALARWAADDLRSTNAHIEWLLRRALQQAGRLGDEPAR